tara:strand:- start:1806 stop:3125 length:1320 start_codon:yes stop_codon:yes gene_type:complete
MKIALVDTSGLQNNRSINKDLNGGYGTSDNFGTSIFAKSLNLIRSKAVNIPILTFVYIATILKNKGYVIDFYYDKLPKTFYDIVIIYGSIVDYKQENIVAGKLKEKFEKSKVGFIGTFAAQMPNLFFNADYIIDGEADAYFLYQFDNNEELTGLIKVDKWMNMDDLPNPDYQIFPFKSYRYKPILRKTPFLTLQTSRGCPYTCSYYCTYPTSQGQKVRSRQPDLIIDDIIFMQKKYSMKSLLFRDPIFGIDKNYPLILSEKLIQRDIAINWGIETRIDLLSKENLKLMKAAGLVSINVGIETNDLIIAKNNKRKLAKETYQDEIIEYCEKIGIKIIGFFMIGFDGDTVNSVRDMIDYALKQKIFMARFSVSTPYPGTKYYDFLENEGMLLHKDFEKYDQFSMVSKQENLTTQQVNMLILEAYRKYYMHPKRIFNMLMNY